MQPRRVILTGLVLAVLSLELQACRDKPSSKSDAAPLERTWPKDAPENDGACTQHSECAMIVWDGPGPPDPCCDVRVGYLPVRRSFLDWFDDYRKRHCAGVTCPPAPLPGAEPTECARIARCLRGKCAQACDDPTYRPGDENRRPSSPLDAGF